MNRMDDQSTMSLQQEEVDSTKKCLNCGTLLNGEYCHNCGQHVTDHTMNVKRFILNYLDNAFLWDPQHLKTIWRLISRPGVLTKDYLAGKFVSQVQPLKLNMFLLFIMHLVSFCFNSPNTLRPEDTPILPTKLRNTHFVIPSASLDAGTSNTLMSYR